MYTLQYHHFLAADCCTGLDQLQSFYHRFLTLWLDLVPTGWLVGLTKQNKDMPSCQKSTFCKSSCFACLMGYFPRSCSGTTESSVPHCMCLVHVSQAVLIWRISDLDSPKSVSLHCTGLFLWPYVKFCSVSDIYIMFITY